MPFSDENLISNEKSKLPLLLYEFEALAKLTPSTKLPSGGAGDGTSILQDVFNEIAENMNVDVKIFETLAGKTKT